VPSVPAIATVAGLPPVRPWFRVVRWVVIAHHGPAISRSGSIRAGKGFSPQDWFCPHT
jgi:hypothetical protein